MRWTVGRKLLGGFLVIALMTLALGLGSLWQMARIKEAAGTSTPTLATLGEATGALANIQRLALRHLLEPDVKKYGPIEQELLAHRHAHATLLARFDAQSASAHERTHLAQWRETSARYARSLDQLLAISRVGDKRAAYAHNVGETVVLYNQLNGLLAEMLVDGTKAADAQVAAADAAYQQAVGAICAAMLLTVGLALGIGIASARQIAAPLAVLTLAAAGIARGELGQRIEIRSRDEIGDLASAFRAMIAYLQASARVADGVAAGDLRLAVTPLGPQDQLGNAHTRMVAGLRTLVGAVRRNANGVAADADASGAAVHETHDALQGLAASAQLVAGNTKALASRVDETKVAAREMNARTREIAGKAEALTMVEVEASLAIQLITDALGQAADHLGAVGEQAARAEAAAHASSGTLERSLRGLARTQQEFDEATAGAEGLGERTRDMAEVVGQIDALAAQAHALAAAATREATRAGDHGRGFAVVADEVQQLAARSSQATLALAAQVRRLQDEVALASAATQHGRAALHEGTRIARSSGRALAESAATISELNARICTITAATRMHARASGGVTRRVARMAELTHEIHAAAAEQARTSSQLARSVQVMKGMTRQADEAAREQGKRSRHLLNTCHTIDAMGHGLVQHARDLQNAVAAFKLGPSPMSLGALAQDAYATALGPVLWLDGSLNRGC